MIRNWLARALAVALLGAWQSALLHPIAHHDRAGGFVHVAGAAHDPDEEGGPSAACDALAAVAACVSGGLHVVVASTNCGESPDTGNTGDLSRSPRLAYRSQAPPRHT